MLAAIGLLCFVPNDLRCDEPILLDCQELSESSGLAVSSSNPEWIWTHNDSGKKPRLYLFSSISGWLYAVIELAGAPARDWEDMCAFEFGGRKYLAVGDIGDNSQKRKSINICILEEPSLETTSDPRRLSNASTTKITPLDRFLTLAVTYPDGPVNCEALVYDDTLSRFLLLTKELSGSRIYSVSLSGDWLNQLSQDQITQPMRAQAEYVQRLGIPIVTGAGLSADSKTLAVCTYGPAYLLERDGDGWSEKTMTRVSLPKRRQGEAIAFSGANQLLVTSEKSPTPLWSVRISDGHHDER